MTNQAKSGLYNILVGTKSLEELAVNVSDPEARCPGNKELLACEAARILLERAASFKPMRHLTATDSMRRTNVLYDLRIGCAVCRYEGVARLDMNGRKKLGTELVFTTEEKNTTTDA